MTNTPKPQANPVNEKIEVVTRYGIDIPTEYSFDGGKTFSTNPQPNTLDEILINLDEYKLNRGGVDFSVAEHYAMYPELKSAKLAIEALINEARNDSLLDLENWAKLHDLDAEMILDGIEHMVISNLQVPDQPRQDNSDRLTQLKENN